MIILSDPEVVVKGLTLPECPRWRGDVLYFSDIAAGRVYRLGAGDALEQLYQDESDYVGGLGFTKEGDLVAVRSKSRALIRLGGDGPRRHADLSGLCKFVLNDMAMHAGRAYVSQPGFDIWKEEASGMPAPTDILFADEQGRAAIAASEMHSPNGMAISPDGRTLYVAESTAMRITCFDIDAASGGLSNRRIFADVPDGGIPDGICLDSEGGVWAALPVAVKPDSYGAGPGVIRLVEGGQATHLVKLEAGRRALACELAGPKRDTLYICTVPDFHGGSAESAGKGRLERIRLAQ